MDYQPGCPARSLAGHDKDQYYIILSVDKDQVLLTDGRRRTLAKPKKKNKKHIQADKELLVDDFSVTDDEIYTRLKRYKKCRQLHDSESCGPVAAE